MVGAYFLAMLKPALKTRLGKYYVGDCGHLLRAELGEALKGKVQLILTSPPFPLNRKKSYGNRNGSTYKGWFARLAPVFADLLTPDGSIVLELGNTWKPRRPVQSLLHLESLLEFVKAPQADLRLCQQFICFNPSRLPSPAAWVTVRKERLTDSFTHLWWMAKSDFPKVHTGRVLRPYSEAMRALLKRGTYNNGHRPSQHNISKKGFSKDRGGSVPTNVLELEAMDAHRDPRLPNAFSIANTGSNDFFFRKCREMEVTPHPARMPAGLASFFVQLLTDRGDLVLDPFAGSNTTGFVAELAGRRWAAIEQQRKYVRQSRIRFRDPALKRKRKRRKTAGRVSR
jgi:site-specific DNA-methyltransferase (cytosine-N4-specific)